MSTGNSFTEMNLTQNHTTLIVGENGSGKSTFLDAITFALYGKPFRKVNKPQLINSINNKHCLVELEFTSGDTKCFVRRGMKPNIFEIWQNDEMIDQEASIKDYQEYLEKQILKLSYKSFCQVVILGSASYIPFMELPAYHRREIIEDLLDLQIFTTMNSLLKDRVASNDKNILDANYKIDLTKEKIGMQEKYLQSLALNASENIQKSKDLIKEYEEYIDQNNKIVKESIAKITKLKDDIQDESKLKKKIDSMLKIEAQLSDKIKNLRLERRFFENNEVCPTCKQGIDDDFKKSTIDDKIHSISDTENGLSLLQKEITKIAERQSLIQKINQQITDLNTDVFVKNNDTKNLQNRIDEIKRDIEVNENKNKVKMSDDELLKNLEKELEDLSSLKKQIILEKELYVFSSILLKDTGIKSRIIKQYVPVINKLINKYLSDLEFVVQFELDENFQETIRSRYRDIFSYASFSEGEKMRINLSILFTWRAIARIRNSASTNLLILDEIFDGSLDTTGTDEFMKILRNVVGDVNTFIISHKTDQLYDKFDAVVKFKKYNNFSQMEMI